MNYGALPPEINSGRMYSGPGPGPMLAAAAAWDTLAIDLYTAAAAYAAAISGLGVAWTGPAAAAMAQAAAPYAAWLSTTAMQAEQAASQAKMAAAAYETAFIMTVPPPAVAANRALSMTLIWTNFFGQNTPAIAATEAEYVEMWAQDATAMYGYASSSAAAARLTPFNTPPATTNGAGLARQTSAIAHAATTPAGLHVNDVISQGSALMSSTQQALHGLATASPTISTDRLFLLLGSRGTRYLSMWSRNSVTGANVLHKTADRVKDRITERIRSGVSRRIGDKVATTVLGFGPLGKIAAGHSMEWADLPELLTTLSTMMGQGLKLGALSVPPAWPAGIPGTP